MAVANLVRLNAHTTDVDAFLAHVAIVLDRLGAARFASTLLGVVRLAGLDLLIELEAIAVD